MKVVIDTNIWISFLIGKLLSNLEDKIIDGQVEILSSKEKLSELFDTLSKPKLSKHISELDIKRLFHFITIRTTFLTIKNDINICRDPKDNFLLEIAKEGNADFIITGDKDLLVLNPYESIKILSYGWF